MIDNATKDEEKSFLTNLVSLSSTKPVILSVIPEFSDAYVPLSVAPDLPPVQSDIYERCNLKLGYYELLEIAETTGIVITPEQSGAENKRSV